VRDAEAGSSHSTDRVRKEWRGLKRLALIAILAASSFAVLVVPASAGEHLVIGGEYGKEGPKATGLGTSPSGCAIGYQSSEGRLFLLSAGKIWGLLRSGPGSVSPLGGSFPVTTGINTSCGDRDLEVDNSSTGTKGRIYAIPSSPATVYAWSPAGSELGSPWPLNLGSGEACGLDVDNSGNVYVGYWSQSTVQKYSSAGSLLATVNLGFQSCKVAVDRTNGDVYAAPYNGGPLKKYTASSGYTSVTEFPSTGTNNPGLAVNGAENRVYVKNGPTVNAYDASSTTLAETITLPEGGGNGLAVDEETDTLFVTIGSGDTGYIAEYLGVKVPKAITGDPIGNDEVTGTADPNEAGSGEITECYFEFGIDTSYGSSQSCNEALPINSVQEVTANLPGLIGEQTYHYRLVLGTGEPGIVGRGGDKTITPHYVNNLHTEEATSITRTTATLNASFEGTNDDTHYYFEWGTTTAYGSQSATPPGDDAGATVGHTPLSFDVSGLTADTTYHYRVVATNSLGTSIAEDKTLHTDPAIKELITLPATEVTRTTAIFNGEIDPDGYETTYYFQYGQTTAYGQTVPAPPGDPVGSTTPGLKAVSVEVTNLKQNLTYHYRIVGVNETGTTFASDDQEFVTPQPPSIEAFTSKNVTAQSADLEARINPNGEETEYYFEYGTATSYGATAPIPPGSLPPGNVAQSVVVPISGLDGVLYHFRIVAKNKWGTTTSEDQTFNFYPPPCPNSLARQQTGAGHTPDCRAYELVTPEEAGTVTLFAAGSASPKASNPPRVMIAGNFGTLEGVNAGNFLFDPYVATRTSTGWETHYTGIPGEIAGGSAGKPGLHAGQLNGAAVADDGLNHIMQWRFGAPSISGEFFYVGTRHFSPYVYGPKGDYLGRYPTNLQEVPGADNPIEFGLFFELVDSPENGWTGNQLLSGNGKHYVFSTNRYQFAEGGRVERDAGPGSVYDNDTDTGAIAVASKTPSNEDIPAEASVPTHFIEPYKLSDDGSHILIGAPTQCNPEYEYHYYLCAETFHYARAHLYMRVDGAMTFDVSQGHPVDFRGMTEDGSKVFFTSAEPLTEDDTDTSVDLFMWSEETDDITRVSIGEGGTGDTDSCTASWIAKCGIEVVPAYGAGENDGEAQLTNSEATDNSVAAVSGDVYFYSPERLVNSSASPGQKNLYVARGDGEVQYVTTIESAFNQRIMRVQVTPSGSFAAFLTATSLTSYDDAGQAMLYLYNADAQAMTCVSCLPSGDPPPTREFPFRERVWTSLNGIFLTDDGRPFFTTPDPLVPRDTNRDNDVYEWTGGRAQLITTGIGEKTRRYEVSGSNFFGKNLQVALAGVSADGVDVYFTTTDTLVAQDHNGAFQKIYDARTNGGFPVAAEVAPCKAADECHAPTMPPPVPPSITSTADLGAGGNASPRETKRHHRKHRRRHRKHRRRDKAHARQHRRGKVRNRRAGK
jgi:hypothetical protein